MFISGCERRVVYAKVVKNLGLVLGLVCLVGLEFLGKTELGFMVTVSVRVRSVVAAVVVGFFNHNFVNCKVTFGH